MCGIFVCLVPSFIVCLVSSFRYSNRYARPRGLWLHVDASRPLRALEARMARANLHLGASETSWLLTDLDLVELSELFDLDIQRLNL